MREYIAPTVVKVDPDENLTTSLWALEASHPKRPALAYREGAGFVDVTTAELADRVRRLAAGFMALGVERGDRVAIFSPTQLEFTLLDYAVWAAGGAGVTIYETSSAEQVEWIVGNSGAKVIVCASDELLAVHEAAAGRLGTVSHAFSAASGGLDEIVAAGAGVTDDQVLERARSVTQGDLATLVYTSGTTGRPKGCMITHGNFVHVTRHALGELSEVVRTGETTLMFLPLAHIFARIVQVACVMNGMRIAYSTGIPNLTDELAMTKPWFVFSVPRVFEKIYNGARQKAADDGKGKIFDRAADVAIKYSQGVTAGKVGFGTKALHGVFDKLVYVKLRAVFGGNLRYSVSGGAALGERLGHFFSGIGVEVLEGYGLTETTAVSTYNSPNATRIGSVGRPAPGTGVRIADDGEVLIKGVGIFQGYWQDPAASAEVLESDGWFHSGDIGELDADGFLRITGRKKEIIVTAAGKNVAPAVLEDRIRAHPLVSQAMVVGDGQPFVASLITIDPEAFEKWAADHGKTGGVGIHTEDPDLIAEIQKAIDDANGAVSRAESVRKFAILPEDFTIEGGELTPTLKVKRRLVEERFADAIAGLFGGGE
jgi:long-chain acyl-CoA synthetase